MQSLEDLVNTLFEKRTRLDQFKQKNPELEDILIIAEEYYVLFAEL